MSSEVDRIDVFANHRVLVIDDNRAIHDDFRKILSRAEGNRPQLDAAAAGLFGIAPRPRRNAAFVIESAFQGKEGAVMVEQALAAGQPYAMAFVDMRMPPGWDGLETIAQLWGIQADLQIVLCTAHSDYSLDQIQEKVEVADRLLILKKPFDTVEVLQLAQALTEKWRLRRLAQANADELTRLVEERTAALRRSTDELREKARLIDLANEAISVHDLEDRIRFWNLGAERVFGWTAEEIIGSDVKEVLQADPSAYGLARKAVLAAGEWRGEMELRTKDDRKVVVTASCTLVRDEQGQPRSILVIKSDVTEQKELEARFLRAQRLESIGTLASGVAHDLNNILAPILMSAPLLRGNLDPQDVDMLVHTIETSARRGADIVRQVLTFARGVEGERMPLQPIHLVREVERIALETFPKNISIRNGFVTDLSMIEGDVTQLHQVLLNLCLNARDSMPKGGTLTIEAEDFHVDENYAAMLPGARSGDFVRLSVRDTGSGIPRNILDHIFEPFFTTKEIGKGTGLGLSTALGIVESHGGFLNVTSDVRTGTLFEVFLPIAAGLQQQAPVEEAAVALTGNGEKILVVDDETGLRSVAEMTLQRNGYITIGAGDGAEAIAIYARQISDIDLVLTDVMMPVMDGVALIHALRRITPDVRIVASSGQGDEARRAELKALGVETLLMKPYNSPKLLTAVHGALHT
ncbi:MAG: sensor hybrid histidine kinase [Chthoniobacter sp.]|nr:sensor hybrid histidine kinase [Chthoniobacter sp.]